MTVAVVMGSDSDWPTLVETAKTLQDGPIARPKPERRLVVPDGEPELADVAQRVREVVLGDRHEDTRRYCATDRALPPAQRLDPDDLTLDHIDLGLEVQSQLLVGQRALDPPQLELMAPHPLILIGIVVVETVAPRLLCPIHGLIGMPQQTVGAAQIRWAQGDADAGAHVTLLFCD